MNRAQLGSKIGEKFHLPKKTGEGILLLVEEVITEELRQDREVALAGFGTFSARVRKGRKGVNPQKPSEPMMIPSVKVPKFKAGKDLKDRLKGKRS